MYERQRRSISVSNSDHYLPRPLVLGAISLLLVGLMVRTSPAQSLLAASDGQHCWIIQPSVDGSRFTIMHRSTADPPNVIRKAQELKGVVIEHGVAAADGQLWLVLADLGVKSIRAYPPIRPGARWSFDSHVELRLPVGAAAEGVTVRSMASSRSGLWVLLEVNDSTALRLIDESVEAGDDMEQIDRGEPPDLSESRLAESSTEARPLKQQFPSQPFPQEAEHFGGNGATDALRTSPAVRSPELPTTRLVRLSGDRWCGFALPAEYGQARREWLVMSASTQRIPDLVTVSDTDPGEIWVFEYQADSADALPTGRTDHWQSGRYALPGRDGLVVVAVDGQLTVAQGIISNDSLNTTVWILRPQVIELGSMMLDQPASSWTVVPNGQHIALLAAQETGQFIWQRMDLRGQILGKVLPLLPPRNQLFAHRMADRLVLAVVFITATLIMFLYWRRDIVAVQLDLPKSVVLGDLGSRAAAGLIDLLPCLFLVGLVFRIEPGQITQSWPGHSGGLLNMLPGAAAIALFILHCSISEWLTARTLGKAILGLRVTGLRGQTPEVWQVLARNLMKVLDLIAFPLMILPLLSPLRQRLGDLVARTVVVSGRVDVVEPESGERDECGHRDD